MSFTALLCECANFPGELCVIWLPILNILYSALSIFLGTKEYSKTKLIFYQEKREMQSIEVCIFQFRSKSYYLKIVLALIYVVEKFSWIAPVKKRAGFLPEP